jgi:uncharacterized protein (TIGR02246 family)
VATSRIIDVMVNPLTADDRLAVMDLIARYAAAIDSGDAAAYAANFTPDGVLDSPPNVHCQGRDEIRRWIGGLFASGRVGGTPAQTRHFVGLPQVQGDAARVRARTYVVIFTLRADGSIGVPSVGSYEDECVKVDGQWLFARRVIRSDLGAFGRS